MNDKNRKAKLRWHCRRGMLELDLLLNQFLAKQLEQLTSKQMDQFESLLEATDPELYAWLLGHNYPTDPELKEFVQFIQMQYSA